eukprot:TRINITY_DN61762_c0_g1_i1.p1 TRINITY_DN61762_c0_g1~~TRINITY_DN61762_c0_g1_i1.p1  ORF type:complete len:369 (-),score=58.59 TRINITY_DN61762_c0_g1_i1:173-1279(-)
MEASAEGAASSAGQLSAPPAVVTSEAAEAEAPTELEAAAPPEPTLRQLPASIPMPSGVTVDSELVKYVNGRSWFYGIAGSAEGTIYKSVGLNEFEPEATAIEDGYVRKSLADSDEEWTLKEYVWNPSRTPVVPAKVAEFDADWYAMHFNGLRPFVVYILNGVELAVYQIPDDGFVPRDKLYKPMAELRMLYTQQIGHYRADRVFVPVDLSNVAGSVMFEDPSLNRDNVHGSWDGNSILAVVGHSCVFVGKFFCTFPLAGDTIEAFYSDVGRNDVPYPVAVGRNFVYFLTELAKVPRSELDPFCSSPADWASAYLHYYNHSKLCPHLTKSLIDYEVPHRSQFMKLLVAKCNFRKTCRHKRLADPASQRC